MADFTSSFWSVFIAVITIGSFIGIIALTYLNSRAKNQARDGDPETMGHVWDEDLAEYNNPMPAWWLMTMAR